MGLEPSVQLNVTGMSENFLADTGTTYSVLIYSGAFSSQTCTIFSATGKATTKRFTQALICCWDGQIFSHQLLVVPECPTPLMGRDIFTKLGTTLVMGSFSAPRALQLLVNTEESITPSPVQREQRLWEDKINPQVWDQGIQPTKLNRSSLSSEIPLSFLTRNNILSKETLERDYSL